MKTMAEPALRREPPPHAKVITTWPETAWM